MKLYQLKRSQFLPLSLDEAWSFFSSPANLAKITPPSFRFDIQFISGGTTTYAGQLIAYKIQIFPLFKSNWLTEITHVNKPYYFVDEQRFGPYAFWHHQHFFKPVDGGIEMFDEVTYAISFGILGRVVNWIFVRKQLNTIFDYRYKVLEQMFSKSRMETYQV